MIESSCTPLGAGSARALALRTLFLGLLAATSSTAAQDNAGFGVADRMDATELESRIRASGMDYDEFQYGIALGNRRFAGLVQDASGALLPRFVGETVRASQASRVAPAANAYRDLYEAKLRLRSLFADAKLGVVSLDIDESRNVVLIGYAADTRNTALADIRRAVAGLQVSPGLVHYEPQPRPTVRAELRDTATQISGGLQFRSLLTCSVGINVIRNGAYGFISANHCAGAAGSSVFQNATGRRVGAVAAFGPRVSSNCPAGVDCRHADVAFYQYDTRNYANLGFIARTGQIDEFSNSISGYSRINATVSNPTLGSVVLFQGQTTGHSSGTANRTCVDVRPYASETVQGNVLYFCQNSLLHSDNEYGAGNGDSGGPLFIERSNGVDFVGLISSSVWNATGKQTWYSPWAQIVKQLGTMQYK